jgi:hypothetical protein
MLEQGEAPQPGDGLTVPLRRMMRTPDVATTRLMRLRRCGEGAGRYTQYRCMLLSHCMQCA